MKKQTTPQSDPNMLAVLHRGGKVWRAVVANMKGAKPAFVAAREFPPDRIGRLNDWLLEQHVGAVLCVLPASSVICRNCSLPDAEPDQLEQALRLQAEAHLLGIAPPHRLAMAVLPAAAGETNRTGLVLAWPETATFDPPPVSQPVTFVPDIAAIAALLNGQRPNEPILWLDRTDGSIALALTHAGGVMLRATREDAETSDMWQTCVGRTMAESALSVGHSGAFIDSLVQDTKASASMLGPTDASLFMPMELAATAASRIQGLDASAASDSKWWALHGIAIGALLTRAGQLSALTRMQQAPPTEAPSRIGVLLESLSSPKTAAKLVIACALLLMFGPLAVSGLRLLVLQLRFGDIAEQHAAAMEIKNQLAIYQELERQKAWPITKLLADITTNTPLGIELTSIRIDNGKDFAVSGDALPYDGLSATEVVLQMQKNLQQDGLFSDVVVTWGVGSNLGNYKFDLSATVARPFLIVDYPVERDFQKWTHAQRRDNEKPPSEESTEEVERLAKSGTTNRTAPANGARSDIDPSAQAAAGMDINPSTSRARSSYLNPINDSGDVLMEASSAAAPPRYIPPPISDEQIKSMSRPELQKLLGDLAKARENRDLDEATRDRLKKEFNLILEQLKRASTT